MNCLNYYPIKKENFQIFIRKEPNNYIRFFFILYVTDFFDQK